MTGGTSIHVMCGFIFKLKLSIFDLYLASFSYKGNRFLNSVCRCSTESHLAKGYLDERARNMSWCCW